MSEDQPPRNVPPAPALHSFPGSFEVIGAPCAMGTGYLTKSYKALTAHGLGAVVQVFTPPSGCRFIASVLAKAGRVVEEGTAMMSQGHL